MVLKELMVDDLKNSLEEASNYITDRLILESLAKNGSISLEEAEFFDAFIKRIITEAAEDFVPDEIQAPAQPILLTDEAGNAYMYQPDTGDLVPVEAPEGEPEMEEAPMAAPEVAPEVAPVAESEEVVAEVVTEATEEKEVGAQVDEATEGAPAQAEVEKEAEADAKEEVKEAEKAIVTESTEETQEVELTESQMIVSNLIKSLGV